MALLAGVDGRPQAAPSHGHIETKEIREEILPHTTRGSPHIERREIK
jgi:hypothetical protein